MRSKLDTFGVDFQIDKQGHKYLSTFFMGFGPELLIAETGYEELPDDVLRPVLALELTKITPITAEMIEAKLELPAGIEEVKVESESEDEVGLPIEHFQETATEKQSQFESASKSTAFQSAYDSKSPLHAMTVKE